MKYPITVVYPDRSETRWWIATPDLESIQYASMPSNTEYVYMWRVIEISEDGEKIWIERV